MLGALDGGCHPGCGEGGEEELAILPRHTKVVVTGNNRTKSVLVGLQGVVKKAVGLGGWHWLVLTNGIEVKLQRNALCVIEPPTGHEEDGEIECGNMQWNSSGTSLQLPMEHICRQVSFFRLEWSYIDPPQMLQWLEPLALGVCPLNILSDDVQAQKPHRSRIRHHKGSSYKLPSRSQSCDSHSKGSVSSSRCKMKVDLSKLETRALWRYWRHFNLVDASPNPSKEQLIDVVQKHFMSQVIIGFVQAAKRLKTICN